MGPKVGLQMHVVIVCRRALVAAGGLMDLWACLRLPPKCLKFSDFTHQASQSYGMLWAFGDVFFPFFFFQSMCFDTPQAAVVSQVAKRHRPVALSSRSESSLGSFHSLFLFRAVTTYGSRQSRLVPPVF